ncbi:BON domain-containing protein [soil metagenome]
MNPSKGLAAAIRAALEHDPEIALGAQPALDVDLRDGTVVLRGEVLDVGVKRKIVQRVAAMRGVGSILDRLRVVVTETRGDGAVAETLYGRFVSEPVFSGYQVQLLRERDADAESEARSITIAVTHGVVRLAGEAGSLSHRRFADVLAWWTPGVADVDNRLLVDPPEDDTDGEINDALRLVFDKDPSLDATQLRAETHAGIVKLEGLVHSKEQKKHAELNAWCILGVHGVDNRITVRA